MLLKTTGFWFFFFCLCFFFLFMHKQSGNQGGSILTKKMPKLSKLKPRFQVIWVVKHYLRCMTVDSHQFRHPYVVMEKILAAEASHSLYIQLPKSHVKESMGGDNFDSSVSWLQKSDEIQVCCIYLLNFFFLK